MYNTLSPLNLYYIKYIESYKSIAVIKLTVIAIYFITTSIYIKNSVPKHLHIIFKRSIACCSTVHIVLIQKCTISHSYG